MDRLPAEAENAFIPLSALQHHLFCPRQCALIHVEQLWAEDAATAEGRLLHERPDAGGRETRSGVRIGRNVALRSRALGVAGRADVVEFRGRPPKPFPVEYKRGRPKPHRADEVQLCAQAICLEEAFGVFDRGRGAVLRGDASSSAGRLRRAAPRAHGEGRRRRKRHDSRRPDAGARLHACLPPLLAAGSVSAAAPGALAGCRALAGTPACRAGCLTVRRMLNTIYVTSEGAWLRKDGENVVVEVEGEERGRAPLHMLDGIVSFSRAGASPSLLGACAAGGITVSLLEPTGRFLVRVEGVRTGNVLLRRAQFRASEDPSRAVPIVRGIVAGKAANQRAVVRRALRDHGPGLGEDARGRLAAAERRLTDVARRVLLPAQIAVLRGLEGEAALAYFAVFGDLVRVDDPAFRFTGRSRRPPLDRLNALLSFLYAMLGHDCRSALEAHGLDPQVGFLHADRPGRASLALDLMEEIRPVLADRLALSLVNRRQLTATDFVVEEAGAVRLTDAARKQVLIAWQERKREELRHPFLGETVAPGMVPYAQAQLLARHLRGDLDGYPPFIWR